METTTPHSLLIIAVMDDHPADVLCIARVLHAHGWQYVLQVLESRQRALRFFDRLAIQDEGQCPDLLLLDFTFPGLDTRALLPWIKAIPMCQRLRIIVTTQSDDPAVQQEALALGADAFFQKPVSFQRFMALGDLIKIVLGGHTQTSHILLGHRPLTEGVHAQHLEARREDDRMAEDRPVESTPGRMTSAGADELGASRAAQAGADFTWHFGRVTSLGMIEIADSRTVTILWEEGGISSQQGDITDEQWEIFKLAFVSTKPRHNPRYKFGESS